MHVCKTNLKVCRRYRVIMALRYDREKKSICSNKSRHNVGHRTAKDYHEQRIFEHRSNREWWGNTIWRRDSTPGSNVRWIKQGRLRNEELVRDTFPYPNHGEYSDPISPAVPNKDHAQHFKALREYSKSLLGAYICTKMKGKQLWDYLITAFHPHIIRVWSRPILS